MELENVSAVIRETSVELENDLAGISKETGMSTEELIGAIESFNEVFKSTDSFIDELKELCDDLYPILFAGSAWLSHSDAREKNKYAYPYPSATSKLIKKHCYSSGFQ